MKEEHLIGRQQEQQTLQEALTSRRAEFIAVYGRRRVGKTYLIEKFFSKSNCLLFQVAGLQDGTLSENLTIFSQAMNETFFSQMSIEMSSPKDWMLAFQQLTNTMEQLSSQKKKVLFFDELPWLASKRSGFKKALDHYWNTKWSKDPSIILIVCGSAASWMINNIINDKGGLHNRVTIQMPLHPFSLTEAHDYLNYQGCKSNQKQTLELYMALGGIPHYLQKAKPHLSASQNLSALCFSRDGQLFKEFDKLFASLFDNASSYVELIKIIAKAKDGITRKTLEQKAKLSESGGTLTARLIALEEAGFIKRFVPIGRTEKGLYYKLIDEYCLFYLTWVLPVKRQLENEPNASYWESKVNTPKWHSWSGYAYEAICLKHIPLIRKALFIPAGSLSGSWQYLPQADTNHDGAQIDLLFDRDDGVVTICEIKYTGKPFEIDKSYAAILQKKRRVFKERTNSNKQLFLSLITIEPPKRNRYSEELITSIMTLDSLFEAP